LFPASDESKLTLTLGMELAMAFADCLSIILESEGGFVNNPQDPGGATNLGITLKVLEDFRGQPQTVDHVRALTVADVSPIYEANYWNAAHCGDCPTGVDLIVFDQAVNQGVGRAVRSLQKAVGVGVDGHIGPATLAAIKAAEAAATINAISADREAFYRGLSTFPTFGKGWLNRLQRTTGLALKMAGG
jgi:lysozyme family protein